MPLLRTSVDPASQVFQTNHKAQVAVIEQLGLAAAGGGEVLSDHFALDERDAIRIGRDVMSRLNWRKLGPCAALHPEPPRYDPEEILGIVSADVKVPLEPREVLARTVDGSEFSEHEPLYGTSQNTTGFMVGASYEQRGIITDGAKMIKP